MENPLSALDALEPSFTVMSLVLGGLWAGVSTVLAWRRENQVWASELLSELREISSTLIERPELQGFLSDRYDMSVHEFKSTGSVQRNGLFIRTKTLVYWHLNVFDGVVARVGISTSHGPIRRLYRRARLWLLFPESSELSDWESYMIERLRHPFFQAVLEEEGMIFGAALRKFYEDNRENIRSKKPLQYLW